MVPIIEVTLALLVVTAAVAIMAARLKIPPAILLVLTGVGLALIPGLPRVALAPEFVLLLVLPPVIYSSAVAMSWREFQFNLRPISLLAVGCVLFTTLATAAAMHAFLGLPWPIGFLIGAIVSPPDAVAPLAIARRLQLPRRIVMILEGEGLANDATALILYRFAVIAVSVGMFSVGHAVSMFVAIVVGEIIWGIGAGWAMLRLRRWVRDPRIEILLSILTPFIAYWPPEQLGGSGVLATVATGLYISWSGPRLISAETRLQGIFFWDFLIYLTEGMIFLLTGLQARRLLSGIDQYSFERLGWSAAVVCAVVISARFIWMYPATYVPRWLSPALARRDPAPPWQWPFALAFTGIRGIVSLAAALAIPLEIEGGTPFPDRDLILFLTFAVILVTLVGQGLLLPTVMRVLGLAHAGRRERHAERLEELAARRQAIEAAIAGLEARQEADRIPSDILEPILTRQRQRLKHVGTRGEEAGGSKRLVELCDQIERSIIAAERDHINELYRRGELKDEARRHIERDLDLRDAHLDNLQSEE